MLSFDDVLVAVFSLLPMFVIWWPYSRLAGPLPDKKAVVTRISNSRWNRVVFWLIAVVSTVGYQLWLGDGGDGMMVVFAISCAVGFGWVFGQIGVILVTEEGLYVTYLPFPWSSAGNPSDHSGERALFVPWSAIETIEIEGWQRKIRMRRWRDQIPLTRTFWGVFMLNMGWWQLDHRQQELLNRYAEAGV